VKLSQKAEYALRAAVDLAQHAKPDRLARTGEIARRTGAPEKFLEAILGELRRAGILASARGAAGGHRLARPAARITAGEVWRAVDGPISLSERRPRRRPSPDGTARALAELFAEVEDAVTRAVDALTIAELARRAEAVRNVPDFSI
jgi:Rrf2 family protein